jgi:hypothetical protein
VTKDENDERLEAARAAGRRELADEVHALIRGRLHLGPTSLGRLSALIDVERDPSLLERRAPRCGPSSLSGCRGDEVHASGCRHG